MDHSLLDQIARGGPDELGQLRVYADQLILTGDSFGELIVVASERLVRDTPELRRREDALLAEHSHRIHAVLGRSLQDTFRWRRGFVDAIEFAHAAGQPFDALPKLAGEPAVRLVRRLAWSDAAERGGLGDLAPIFKQLAALAERFPRLVEIAVREGPRIGTPWIDGAIDVAPLYAAFPRLEVLDLDCESVQLGEIVLPEVRRFRATKLALEDIRRIVAAQMPKLEELELGFRYARADNIAATFGPLLHRDFGPQLAALSISPPTIDAVRWVYAELQTCPLARHVRRLAFRGVFFGEDLLRTLIADAGAWKRLERLELNQQNISASMMKQLSRTFGSTLALV